jgi:hypothetical protein
MEQNKRMEEWENGFKTWKEFFEASGEQHPTFRSNYDSMGVISHATVEELYQHFKARMLDEVVAEPICSFERDGKTIYYASNSAPLKNKEE